MACGGIDPHNVYLWASLAGILLGGGFSFIITAGWRRNITAALVFFSAAVLSGLCGVILAGVDVGSLSSILIWLGSSFAIGFAAFLFPKALGIPLFFILFITVSILYSSLISWSCVPPGGEICSFHVISRSESFIRLQYSTDDLEGVQQKLESGDIHTVLEFIEFPDYFFLTSGRRIYRFNGFSSAVSAGTIDDPRRVVLRLLLKLPGVSSKTAVTVVNTPSPSVNYIFSLGEDGQGLISRDMDS